MNTEEKLRLASDAVNYVLGRIREDENIKYYLGTGTEAYAKLKAAHLACNDREPGDLDMAVLTSNGRKADAVILLKVRAAFDNYDARTCLYPRGNLKYANELINTLREVLK
ncbi:MAG: hypothetical protein V4587_00280 [Acidobacteriota bacterium]